MRALLPVARHRMCCAGALRAPGEFLRRNGNFGAGLPTGSDRAAPVGAVRSRGERRRAGRREMRRGAVPLPAVPPARCAGLGRRRVPLGPVPVPLGSAGGGRGSPGAGPALPAGGAASLPGAALRPVPGARGRAAERRRCRGSRFSIAFSPAAGAELTAGPRRQCPVHLLFLDVFVVLISCGCRVGLFGQTVPLKARGLFKPCTLLF